MWAFVDMLHGIGVFMIVGIEIYIFSGTIPFEGVSPLRNIFMFKDGYRENSGAVSYLFLTLSQNYFQFP